MFKKIILWDTKKLLVRQLSKLLKKISLNETTKEAGSKILLEDNHATAEELMVMVASEPNHSDLESSRDFGNSVKLSDTHSKTMKNKLSHWHLYLLNTDEEHCSAIQRHSRFYSAVFIINLLLVFLFECFKKRNNNFATKNRVNVSQRTFAFLHYPHLKKTILSLEYNQNPYSINEKLDGVIPCNLRKENIQAIASGKKIYEDGVNNESFKKYTPEKIVTLKNESDYVKIDIKNLIKQVYKCSIHEVSCFEPYMTFIEEGKKTIEGRVGTSYYTKIRSGSILRLHNRKKEIWCEVTRTRAYSTFKDMLEKEGLKNMLPQAKSIEEGVRIYRKFPTFAEKEHEFGAYAIEVKFIDLEKLQQKASVVTPKEKRLPKQNYDYRQDHLLVYQHKPQNANVQQPNSTLSDTPHRKNMKIRRPAP